MVTEQSNLAVSISRHEWHGSRQITISEKKEEKWPKSRTGMNHEIFLLLYNWNCEKRGAWIFIETEGKSWCCRLPTPRDLLRKIKKYFSNAKVLDLGRQIPRKRFQWSMALSVGFCPQQSREKEEEKKLCRFLGRKVHAMWALWFIN